MLIVFYGINNLGKSTQAKRLVERLISEGFESEYIKYPHYNIKPFGDMINDYLRNGNPENLSAREAQKIYTLDRFNYQPTLRQKLDSGVHIIAEDYTGTGLAWGAGTGVDLEYLKKINSPLIKEDIAFYFYGERFLEAKEKGHKHEENDSLMTEVHKIHDKLADTHGWIPVHANREMDEIHDEIWEMIKEKITA